MNITSFSQRDPRWQAELLGTGPITIGRAGCLITSMASLLVDFGVPTDPHRLNLWLRSHGGYSAGTLFNFRSAAGLGADLADYVDCARTPAPVDALITALEGGCGVIIKVDSDPGGTLNPHWVRLVSLSAKSGWIMDPWQLPGGEMIGVHDYLAPGWNTGRGIFAAAVYTRNGAMAFEALEPRGVHQEELAIRGV